MILFHKKYRFRLSIGVILVFFFLILIGQTGQGRIENWFTRSIQTISLPVQWVSNWTVNGTVGTWKNYVWLLDVAEKNKEFKRELAILREANHKYLELQKSHNRILDYLEFEKTNDDTKVFAQVVGEKIDSFSRLLILNKGKKQGIKKNFAVVTPIGVVGKIQSVTDYQSIVQLLNDSRSSFPIVVQRTRSKAMAHGDFEGNISVDRFPRRIRIEEGDVVVSSGLAGIFPKGFPLGTVASVDKKDFGLFQKITLRPAVDLNRLEEVAVVLYSPGNIHQPLFTE